MKKIILLISAFIIALSANAQKKHQSLSTPHRNLIIMLDAKAGTYNCLTDETTNDSVRYAIIKQDSIVFYTIERKKYLAVHYDKKQKNGYKTYYWDNNKKYRVIITWNTTEGAINISQSDNNEMYISNISFNADWVATFNKVDEIYKF
jgi:thioredoxin-related protein